jgi:peptidoglycan/xylan/chitin deacetylase (PgdA/CDA1 family)
MAAIRPAPRTPAGRRQPTRRSWLLLASLLVVLLLIPLLAWGLATRFGGWPGASSGQPTPASRSSAGEQLDTGYQAEALTLAHRYMQAFLQHDYATMWSLLAPERRSLWPSEEAFRSFWQLRFQDYLLGDVSFGTATSLAQWIDPETMAVYTNVVEVPISLQIQPDATLSKQAQLPPEDRQPADLYRNLPFIAQRQPDQATGNVSWQVLDGGPADPEAPILPPLDPLPRTVATPILMYHHISPAPTHNLLDESLTVKPSMFAAQLDYLKAQGYHTITFNQLFNALYFGAPLPAHPIILTFDDGYEDVYQYALPLLRSHGFSGMFYIITGVVGQPNYMNWNQIRDLLAQGMQIGSHTVHHISLGWIVIGDPQQTQQELQVSQATLQKQLGIAIQQFCYPSGEPFRNGTALEQQRITAMLAADGYIGATTDPGRTGYLQSSTTPFALLRIRVDGRETLSEFIASIPKI